MVLRAFPMHIRFSWLEIIMRSVKSLDRLRGHPLFIFAHLRAGGCFALSKMHSVHQKAVFCTEFPFGTVEACFLHRVYLKTRRVHQEAFFRTECIFRTPGGPLSGAGIRCGTSNFKKKRPTFFVDLIDRLDVNCNYLQAKTVPRESKAKDPCPLGCHGLTFVLKTEAQPLVRQIIRLDYFAVHGGAIS